MWWCLGDPCWCFPGCDTYLSMVLEWEGEGYWLDGAGWSLSAVGEPPEEHRRIRQSCLGSLCAPPATHGQLGEECTVRPRLTRCLSRFMWALPPRSRHADNGLVDELRHTRQLCQIADDARDDRAVCVKGSNCANHARTTLQTADALVAGVVRLVVAKHLLRPRAPAQRLHHPPHPFLLGRQTGGRAAGV
jgi:hypothetical protein